RGCALAIRPIAAQRTLPTMNTVRGRRGMSSSIAGVGRRFHFLARQGRKVKNDSLHLAIVRPKEHIGALRHLVTGIAVAAALAVTATHLAADDVTDALDRIGDRVAQYYSTAQSIVALETVRIQPESRSMSPEGFARVLVYDLRVDWTPPLDADH